MSEARENIERRCSEYDLAGRERELVAYYYRQHLFPNAFVLPIDDIVKAAASARNIASMWADLTDQESAIVPSDGNAPISCAARVMYFASELLVDPSLKAHWSREAALAFLQAGNLAASRTAWSRYENYSSDDNRPGDALITDVLSLAPAHPESTPADIPLAAKHPWTCTSPALLQAAKSDLYEMSFGVNAPAHDRSVAYRVSQSLPLLGTMSLTKVASEMSVPIPQWYYDALEKAQRLILMPSQYEAVRQLLEDTTHNCVLCTPTSSGKTFVAEVVGILGLSTASHGCHGARNIGQ